MAQETGDSEQAWHEWTAVQRDLFLSVDMELDRARDDGSDQFTAALISALIEHLAGLQRRYLDLPASDARKTGEKTP
jgi:hypothetical protein